MFERFTEQARQVVVLAQQEARELRHNYIGTEHLLLGLIHNADFFSAQILESFGLTTVAVRGRVVQAVGLGDAPHEGQMPFTPRAKRILELSLREALALGHSYIGTGHVLLGLLRQDDGLAARILLDLDAKPEQIRERVLERIGESEPETGGRHSSSAIHVSSGFNVHPDPQLRKLLMATGALALRDGREEFGIADLVSALKQLPEARKLFAAGEDAGSD